MTVFFLANIGNHVLPTIADHAADAVGLASGGN